jgi:hypothetical protein
MGFYPLLPRTIIKLYGFWRRPAKHIGRPFALDREANPGIECHMVLKLSYTGFHYSCVMMGAGRGDSSHEQTRRWRWVATVPLVCLSLSWLAAISDEVFLSPKLQLDEAVLRDQLLRR